MKGFSRRRIHERTIWLRFLSITLRVLKLEVLVDTMFTLQTSFKSLLLNKGVSRGDCEVKTLKTFVPIMSKNSASVDITPVGFLTFYVALVGWPGPCMATFYL
jgi:hypothetical protein